MYQFKKIIRATFMDLTVRQMETLNEVGHVTNVWMVDDIPAIAVGTDTTHQPTHWWQNGRWEEVSFDGYER